MRSSATGPRRRFRTSPKRSTAEHSMPDEAGMVEVELSAASRDEALERVRDAVAAAGAEEGLTFPETTGTRYEPPGHRAAPPDERPEPEPPHARQPARGRPNALRRGRIGRTGVAAIDAGDHGGDRARRRRRAPACARKLVGSGAGPARARPRYAAGARLYAPPGLAGR